MTELPTWLRISPYLFYAGAILFGFYHFFENLTYATEMQDALGSDADALAKMKFILQSRPFFVGLQEGTYMAANGAIVHVLIAIYDKMKGQPA